MQTRVLRPASTDAAVLATEIRAVVGSLKRRLRQQTSSLDLTPSQVSVLLRLEGGGPATVSGLARAEGMRPQSMGAIVAALEGAGLVTSSPDPADGRQTLLSLTASCREKVRAGRAARQDWLTRALEANFSARERARIGTAIELLRRLSRD